jgi:hypothetical protein
MKASICPFFPVLSTPKNFNPSSQLHSSNWIQTKFVLRPWAPFDQSSAPFHHLLSHLCGNEDDPENSAIMTPNPFYMIHSTYRNSTFLIHIGVRPCSLVCLCPDYSTLHKINWFIHVSKNDRIYSLGSWIMSYFLKSKIPLLLELISLLSIWVFNFKSHAWMGFFTWNTCTISSPYWK